MPFAVIPSIHVGFSLIPTSVAARFFSRCLAFARLAACFFLLFSLLLPPVRFALSPVWPDLFLELALSRRLREVS